jgi:hypothetical protein
MRGRRVYIELVVRDLILGFAGPYLQEKGKV